jgi:hypothetical protein
MSKRFGGVGDAKMTKRGVFLEPVAGDDGEYSTGEYEVEIQRCEYFKSRKNEEYFVCEYKVVASNNEKHPVGLTRTWMPKMNEDMSEANLKGFVLACLGIDANDEPAIEKVKDEIPDVLEAALDGPDKENTNALKGTRIHVSVQRIITKEKKQPFNAHTFAPPLTKAA